MRKRLRGTRSRATETVAVPQAAALDGSSCFVQLLFYFFPAVIIGQSSVRNGEAGRPSLFHKLTTG